MAKTVKKHQLSPNQAFAAMTLFLERYCARTGDSDDLEALLGDIQLNERDGLPLDPAACTDWLSAVEDVLGVRERNEQIMAER